MDERATSGERRRLWTLLSNHGHVLVCLAQNPDMRLRDVAELVGITERAVQAIVADLEDAHFLTRVRVGRRNHYELHTEEPMRHPLEHEHAVGELLQTLAR